MNTGQANQEKRTIKVKDFLDDFRGGMHDQEILKKYHLTPLGLEKFYGMLLERGILGSDEIDEHYRQESLRESEDRSVELEKSSFICPCCLSSHDTMFDICPSCGVSFQELMSRDYREEDLLVEREATSQSNEKKDSDEDSRKFEDLVEPDPFGAQEADFSARTSSQQAKRETTQEQFVGVDGLSKNQAKYDDALDEIIPGMPLEYVDDAEPEHPEVKVRCENCDEAMEPALRDVYDRGRSYFALLLAGASLVLGVLGLTALGFFNSYSLARLLVLYATGLSLLSSVAFLAAGSFMYLARERVYFCSFCNRVFPRG